MADQMHRVYLAKGAQATTAIEGNTLSEDEVSEIVAGLANPPPPSQEYLYLENIVRGTWLRRRPEGTDSAGLGTAVRGSLGAICLRDLRRSDDHGYGATAAAARPRAVDAQ